MVQLTDLIARYRHPCRHRVDGQITRIVVHHDAGVAPTKKSKVLPRFDAYALQHDQVGGFPYHYPIDPWGEVYKCRATTDVTSHVRNQNTPSLGVMLMGCFHPIPSLPHGQLPTDAQYKSLEALLAELVDRLPNVHEILPHRKVPGSRTACPGDRFNYEWLADVTHRLLG